MGFHNDIKQWHIPRYVMAKVLGSLRILDGFESPEFVELFSDLDIALTPDRKIRFSLRAIAHGLSDQFSKSLEQDIPFLEKARSLVKEKDGVYILPRAKTVYGSPVVDGSKELIHAIAFERLTRKKLDATKFGIYSAYCTQTDFSEEQRLPDSEIERLMAHQFSYDPDELPEEVIQAVMLAQSKFLGKHIWGPNINVGKNEAVEVFVENLKKLKLRNSTQFSLMIGMHNPSIFLPIAIIFEVISYRKYLEWMTSSLQPDSQDAQYMLGTTSFIELFGNL